ncbi:MAG: DUF4347 domain-containing protein [Myxococcota bacterium]|nr:DUF4347 domain-containing protein [Myxococcota bacterium]
MTKPRGGSGPARRRRAVVEPLEPRILLSADLPGAALAPADAGAEHVELVEPVALRSGGADRLEQLAATRELVLVDAGVKGHEALIADLQSERRPDRRLEVVVLDPARDGVAQISEALAARAAHGPLDAVHVVSHGSDRGLQLGSTWLGAESLAARREAIAGWGRALGEDADLLLYGCNLGGSAAGRELVGRLAHWTGADVAASSDPTGAAARGGDWDLEVRVGRVQASVAFSVEARSSWTGLLLPPTADASNGAPYGIAEGDALQLDGTASSDPESQPLLYFWDLDGDGNFLEPGEPFGPTPLVSWSTLVARGIDDDGSYPIGLRVVDPSAQFDTTTTTLTVVNTAPAISVSGAASVAAGDVYTLSLSAVDPGDETISWTIDWGDGTVDTVGDLPAATHTYTQGAFTRNITVSVTDDDGTWTNSDLVVGNWRNNSDDVFLFDGETGAFVQTFDAAGNDIDRPYHAVVGPDGNFYVTGYDTDKIVRFDPGGAYLDEFVAPGSGGLRLANSLAFGPDDNLYVSSYGSHEILRFDPAGNFLDVFASGGQLNGPSGLTFGPDGDLYVASYDNGRLVKIDGAAGGTPTTLASGLGRPEQIVFDGAGDLYIATGSGDSVMRWDGASLTPYFTHPQLDWSSGLAFGPDGQLYVASYDNDRVLRYDGVTGEVFVAAGAGGLRGTGFLSFTPDHQVRVTAGVPAPTPGMGTGSAIWAEAGSPVPATSDFDGTGFGPVGPTADVGGTWRVIAGAEAPTRDEKIVVGVDSAGDLSGMVWNGSSWSSSTPIGFLPVSENDRWGFDVAYESQSGDAVIVFNDGLFTVGYVVWDGTGFSAPTPILPPPGTAEAVQMKLAASPVSDEMVLVVTTANNEDYALIWNGSGWGSPTLFPGGGNSVDDTDVSVVYEQQSGRPMVVNGGSGRNARYHLWDGASWSNDSIPRPAGSSGQTRWTALAADPNSNRIVFGAISENKYAWLATWDGSSWEPSVLATSDAPRNDRQSIAVAFETSSGEAIAAYATSTNQVRYRTWSPAGGWSGEQVGPDLGDVPTSLTLDADPGSDSVMLSVVDERKNVSFAAWDGATWTVQAELEADAGVNNGQPFLFLWGETSTVSTNLAPMLFPIGPGLVPISEDDVTNPGQPVSSLTGAAFDPDGGGPLGMAITSLSSGNGSWQFSTDGGTLWTPVGAVAETSALLLRPTDRIRFVPDARNGTVASFDFRAWDQTAGSGGTKVDVSSHGGRTAFSSASDTATILAWSVNDAPTLDASGDLRLTNVIEDDPGPPGNTVAAILGSAGGDPIGDVDTGALDGIAVTGVDDGNGIWQYSTDGGSIWTPFGTVSTGAAVLLDPSARVRFVPAPSYTGPAGDLRFQAWDQSTGASGDVDVDVSTPTPTGAFSAASETATLDVIPINDAPVLTPVGPSLDPITEDEVANGGQTVASIVGASITDADAGASVGIAVTGLASGNGTWEYSLDGITWNAIGPVSEGSARLLRDTDFVRFIPDGLNADNASFTFRAWDQTTGPPGSLADASIQGGTTAFSVAADTADISVGAVNDAPTLDASGALVLSDVAEDELDPAGDSVAAVLASAGGDPIADVDRLAVDGIAVVSADDTNGRWEFSIDGGAIWNGLGGATETSAVLLDPAARIRFVPAPGFNGSGPELKFRAWDQSAGVNGQTGVDVSSHGGVTPYSATTETVEVTVTPQNDAPVLTPSAPLLTPITEDDLANPGDPISALLGASVTDADAGAVQGIAITGLSSGNGTWEYSIDGGSTWSPVGGVSDASALLLRASDCVRFVPDGQNADAASFSFRAWDQTAGAAGDRVDASVNGDTAAFSTATDTASIAVSAVNDAPVLTPTAPTLPTITEDELGNPGALVSTLLGGLADVDAGSAAGLAITGLDSGNGTWQYRLAAGPWQDVGAVSDASALLLRDGDQIRFVPDGRAADAPSFAFRAWDRTGGSAGSKVDTVPNGGTTAFSTATDTASLTVTAVNDAPWLATTATLALADVAEDAGPPAGAVGTSIDSLVDFAGGGGLDNVSDVDPGALTGIAVTSADTGTGTWHFSIDGGASWIPLGPVSDDAARLLAADGSTRIYFEPAPGFQGSVDPGIGFRAWDRTTGANGGLGDTAPPGGSSAFSAAQDTASITVTPVNDAPAGADATVVTAEDVPYVFAAADFGFSDPDGDALLEVRIASVPALGTLRAGPLVLAGGESVSAAAIAAGDLVYTPAPGTSGPALASFTFQVRDDGGTANGGVDLDPTPNTITIDVTTVNDAPVLAPAAPALPTVSEDQVGNPGALVATIVGSSITDADPGAQLGIAITELESGNGTWQVRLSTGPWQDVGPVSDANALLLRDTDSIRFVPDGHNADSAAFRFRAWDQTAGVAGGRADTAPNGGSHAFSTAVDRATLTVTAVNDAPGLGDAMLARTNVGDVDPPGARIDGLFAGVFRDVDAGASLSGVAVVGNAADPAGEGTWEYSSDEGAHWFAIGAVGDDATALVLGGDARVRFVPAGSFAGVPAALVVRGLDDAYAGGQSSTAGGVEIRAQVDTSASGGTSAIAAARSAISTFVLEDLPEEVTEPLPPDEPDPPPPDEPEPASEPDPEPEPEPLTGAPATEPGPAPGLEPPASAGPPIQPPVVRAGPEIASVEPTEPPAVRRELEREVALFTHRSLEALRDFLAGRAPVGASFGDLIFSSQRSEFFGELDRVRNQLDTDVAVETRVVGSSVAITTGLSIGYVIWLTRGGLLLASLVSSLPAWQLIDPIPVLIHLAGRDDEESEDDESLDAMLDRSAREPAGKRG